MSNVKYTFLSWARQGLGQFITTPGDSHRGTVGVDLTISNGDTVPTKNIELVGPGDVVGIDPRNIIKLHPERDTGNFESNYLAFIEFYQDTFLWDYSPKEASGNTLKPWLFLLVLEDSEYTLEENPQDLDSIDVSDMNVFPPHGELHLWAHLHVNAAVGDISALEAKIDSNPDFATSRLVSPRRLNPNKSYQAFVIPSFEIGRKAGLGIEISEIGQDALKASWELGESKYPVYYRWKFQTGAKGDFESLVRELAPLKSEDIDESIGFRPMDISEGSEPYGDSLISAPDVTKHEYAIGGALHPISSGLQAFDENVWQGELSELLNLKEGQDFVQNGDPVIVPPTYGHWHALVSELDANDYTDSEWLHQLNLNPAHRAAAGLGVKVVQENQDKYLETAWDQIGSVLEANQLLKQSQLGIEIAVRWWEKHFEVQSPGELLSLTAPVLSSVICGNQGTSNVQMNIEEGALPLEALDPAFRRISKANGRLAKRLKKSVPQNKAKSRLVRSDSFVTNFANGKSIRVAPEKTVPDGKDYADSTRGPGHTNLVSLTPCEYPNFVKDQNTIRLPELYVKRSGIKKPQYEDLNIPVSTNLFSNGWKNLMKNLGCEQEGEVQPPPFDIVGIISCVKSNLNPSETIKNRTLTKIGTVADLDAIVPIMAAPDFPQPMYKKLLEESTDFILPNLHKLPNNTISLMETNQSFIESFMVGLNYEMANELIWNEYPTDQRGSYFRQFWDVSRYVDWDNTDAKELAEKLKDIDFIHRWVRWTSLGEHRMGNRLPEDPPTSTPLVLTIRGDLLNRYPETVIFAMKADQNKNFDGNGELKYPIFSAKIEPDITFLGFDLSFDDLTGQGSPGGWFFCIKEAPTGPRFGMDIASDKQVNSADDLHWGKMSDLNNIIESGLAPDASINNWGESSADMADILYQSPVLVAIHGTQML